MTLGAPLLMNYSIELTHILDQISYQQGSLGGLYPSDLSITAQLTEYWQFKSKVPALNTWIVFTQLENYNSWIYLLVNMLKLIKWD